jgi:hypothetical protein
MRLFPGEPVFGPWRVEPITSVLARIQPGVRTPTVAVDGRSAGGKTTSDRVDAPQRGMERDGGPSAEAFWREWETEEEPFLPADRPWEPADLIVAGSLELAYDPSTELVGTDRMMRP